MKKTIKKCVVISSFFSCNISLENKNIISENDMNNICEVYSQSHNNTLLNINNKVCTKYDWEAKRVLYNEKYSSTLRDFYNMVVNTKALKAKYITSKLCSIDISVIRPKVNHERNKQKNIIKSLIDSVDDPSDLIDIIYNEIDKLNNSSNDTLRFLYSEVFKIKKLKDDPHRVLKFLKLFLDKGLNLDSYKYGYDLKGNKHESFCLMIENPIKPLLSESGFFTDHDDNSYMNLYKKHDNKNNMIDINDIKYVEEHFRKYQSGKGNLTIDEGKRNTSGGKSGSLYKTYTIYYTCDNKQIPLFKKTVSTIKY